MNAIIDLSSELLIDRSQVRNPYLRLLLTAIGEELVEGSPWIAINKRVASQDRFACQLIYLRPRLSGALSA